VNIFIYSKEFVRGHRRALLTSVMIAAVSMFLVSCGQKTPVYNTGDSGTASEKILYYTCGMHLTVKVSPEEYKKGSRNCPICNMGLVPVYKEEEAGIVAQPVEHDAEEAYYGCGVKEEGHCPHCDLGKPDAKCICAGHSFVMEGNKLERCPVCKKPLKKIDSGNLPTAISSARKADKHASHKILYYRNPMSPQITSKVPAKDNMGMDYVPVYEDELSQAGAGGSESVVSRVRIRPEQIALAGVETNPIARLKLYKTIRTVGRVAYDPELVVAQEEFISSLKAFEKIQEGKIEEIKERASSLVESSKRKLRLLGLSEGQINELGEKKEVQGNLILPGNKMWIYGEAYEYELNWIKSGEKVTVTATSIPGEEFEGVISSINPVIDPKSRSVTFRAEIDNPGLKLKPEMYVDVIIKSTYVFPDGEPAGLAIPKDALLDTGIRKIVWVEKGNGEYEGREVKVGPEAAAFVAGIETGFYPVLKGINEGELVVTRANFLIDSQSQISGVASAAYGGALTTQESAHQH